MSAAAQASIVNANAFPKPACSRVATILAIALADITALVLSGIAAMSIRAALDSHFEISFVTPAIPAMAVFPLVFIAFGLYPGLAAHPVVEFQSILKASGLTLMLVVCSAFLLKQPTNYSRFLFFVAWALSVVLISSCRALVRRICSKHSWWGVPTVVMGDADFAQEMVRTLTLNRELGLRPVALLTLPSAGFVKPASSSPEFITASIEVAPLLAKVMPRCYAVVSLPQSPSQLAAHSIAEYARGFSHVFVIPNLAGLSSLWVSSKEIGGVLGIEVSQPLDQSGPKRIKRFLDVIVACAMLLLLAPLFGALYLAVLLTSGRPVFFGHSRIGFKGQLFTAWKLRTMVQNADQVLEEQLNASETLRNEWHTHQKLRRDPRITPLGRLLRKSSLDELPQIWNVLRGQMSFVGPRPIVAAEIAKYGDKYLSYLRVKPGITGLWQISGRNNTTYRERVRLDEYYVRNWSVWLDIYILYNSVKAVLFADGAC